VRRYAQVSNLRWRSVDFGQNTPRIRKQCFTRVRELSAAPRTDKELNAEMTLHLAMATK
jgi:hypothetical protein